MFSTPPELVPPPAPKPSGRPVGDFAAKVEHLHYVLDQNSMHDIVKISDNELARDLGCSLTSINVYLRALQRAEPPRISIRGRGKKRVITVLRQSSVTRHVQLGEGPVLYSYSADRVGGPRHGGKVASLNRLMELLEAEGCATKPTVLTNKYLAERLNFQIGWLDSLLRELKSGPSPRIVIQPGGSLTRTISIVS
jgi:hypothetical protein